MEPLETSARRAMSRFLEYPMTEAGAAYLAKRGLLEVATDRLRFGVVDSPARPDHRRFAGRLIIPSFSARGTVVDLAFRCIEDHDCSKTVLWTDQNGNPRSCSKYLFLEGAQKRLWNVAAVQSSADRIHICEGQLNAATLVACGEAAVGCAGANSWKPHMRRLFQGFDQVIIWKDMDDKEPKAGDRLKGGDLFVSKVRRDLPRAQVMMVAPGMDVNSFYAQHGKDGLLALLDDRDEDEDGGDDDGLGEPPF